MMKTIAPLLFAAALLPFAACSKNGSTDVQEQEAESIEDAAAVEEEAHEVEVAAAPDEAMDAVLDDALIGQEWPLVRINDASFDIENPVTIAFDTDGRIAGSAGCNRYMGGYAITGDGEIQLTLGGTTMKMCPEDVMDVEQRVLDILPTVATYSIDDASGTLTLTTENGDEIAGE